MGKPPFIFTVAITQNSLCIVSIMGLVIRDQNGAQTTETHKINFDDIVGILRLKQQFQVIRDQNGAQTIQTRNTHFDDIVGILRLE